MNEVAIFWFLKKGPKTVALVTWLASGTHAENSVSSEPCVAPSTNEHAKVAGPRKERGAWQVARRTTRGNVEAPHVSVYLACGEAHACGDPWRGKSGTRRVHRRFGFDMLHRCVCGKLDVTPQPWPAQVHPEGRHVSWCILYATILALNCRGSLQHCDSFTHFEQVRVPHTCIVFNDGRSVMES